MLGRDLLHGRELLVRFLALALPQQQRHDRGMRRDLVGLRLDRLAKGGQRGLRLFLRKQDLPLEKPGVALCGRLRQRRLDERERAGQVTAGRLELGLAQQRARIVGLRCERGGERLLRAFCVIRREASFADRHLEVGLGRGRRELGAGEFVDHLLARATQCERARQSRHHLVGRILEIAGLAKLLFRPRRIAGLEQRPAQKEARLGAGPDSSAARS